jgi:hypothetical protein
VTEFYARRDGKVTHVVIARPREGK